MKIAVDNPYLLAQVFNKQGNWLTILAGSSDQTIKKDNTALYQKALQKYQDSAKFAKQANASVSLTKAKINIAKVTFLRQPKEPNKLEEKSITIVIKKLKAALPITYKLPASHVKSFGLLALGKMAIDLAQILERKYPSKHNNLQSIAYLALQEAQKSAKEINDNIALSYTYGYLGELYYDAKRYSESLFLTRKALFLIQQADFLPDKLNLSEITYRWYWQLGRLFKAQNEPEKAIEMYESAIEFLQPIRQVLANTGYCGQRQQLFNDKNFHNSLAPLYYELMDLLIQQIDLGQKEIQQTNRKSKNLPQLLLKTLERFKIAEFQDYDGKCVEVLKKGKFNTRIKNWEKVLPNTAIIYPILLPRFENSRSQIQERTRLLVKISEDLFLLPVNIFLQKRPFKRIKRNVRAFYNRISNSKGKYQRYAKQLYDWFIKPIETILKNRKIDTLVIVPDSILRTIPFGALHDGEQFLIEKYAVAVTQGLTLTKPEKLSANTKSLFLGGVSDSVKIPINSCSSDTEKFEKFEKLKNVPKELENISSIYSDFQFKQLLDSEFQKTQLEYEIKKNQYGIIHIASHGEFKDNPRNNFIIAYDEKVTMDLLEEFIKYNAPQASSISAS